MGLLIPRQCLDGIESCRREEALNKCWFQKKYEPRHLGCYERRTGRSFAVPFHRGLLVGERQDRIVDFKRRAVATEFPSIELFQSLIQFQNGIHRAFHHTCHVADDVSDRQEIFVQTTLNRVRRMG